MFANGTSAGAPPHRRVRIAVLSLLVLPLGACEASPPVPERSPPEQSDRAEPPEGAELADGRAPAMPDEHDHAAHAGTASGHDHAHAPDGVATAYPRSLDELPEGVNVVQNEMQLLSTAMQNILVHIANHELERIPAEIPPVHTAGELTASALEQGHYQPPVNGGQIDAFRAMDESFHDGLVRLLRAARADDVQGATESYRDLVSGCTACHAQFRWP